MSKNTATCYRCGEVTPMTPEMERASRAEAKALWSERERKMEGEATVCDACFQEFMKWMAANPGIRQQ